MLLVAFVALSVQAASWDEQAYKQIEKSIQAPQISGKDLSLIHI